MAFIPSFLTEAQAQKVLCGPQSLKNVTLLPKAAAKDLAIDWGVVNGENGRAVVAVCEGAICWIGPVDLGEARAIKSFKQFFAKASLREKELPLMKQALKKNPPALPLLLLGTAFQHSVWRLLLRIPRGALVRYADLARAIGKPKAARAVGNAVGANPVAWLNPCHRVGHSDGGISGFASGEACKRRWLMIEAA
jgi:AraC family transcriptional regulator of adaptative response/methylated-DNA-[protein]-cysteine methyltransferase